MDTTHEARTTQDRREASDDRRQAFRMPERRTEERRGMMLAMADALEDILRAEVRAGLYRD